MESFSPFKLIFHITAKVIFLNEKFDVTVFLWSFLFNFRIKWKLCWEKYSKSLSFNINPTFSSVYFPFFSFFSPLIFKDSRSFFQPKLPLSLFLRSLFSFVSTGIMTEICLGTYQVVLIFFLLPETLSSLKAGTIIFIFSPKISRVPDKYLI